MAEQRAEFSRSAFRRLQTLQRAYLDAAERTRAGNDYPDFFVEGSGPAWHERWPEVITAGERFDPSEVQNRIRALKGLNVFQAFARLQQRAESEEER